MRHDQRPEVGTKVHLRPVTKTAPLVCHRYLEVEVAGYDHWPLVTVWVGKMPDIRQMDIHADNIGLHPSKNKTKGDQASALENMERQLKTMQGKKLPLDMPEGWEEQPLW